MATDIERLIREIRALPPEDQDRLRHALAEQVPRQEPERAATPEELAEVEYQERLVKAGLLEQVRPRRRDQRAFDRFQPIKITGKPLSETIIEERR
jgi:hypothetical protein